jgi:hypothetical protein
VTHSRVRPARPPVRVRHADRTRHSPDAGSSLHRTETVGVPLLATGISYGGVLQSRLMAVAIVSVVVNRALEPGL